MMFYMYKTMEEVDDLIKDLQKASTAVKVDRDMFSTG